MSFALLAGTVEALVRSRAHPGCYGCRGTGTLQGFGNPPGIPCTCVMHSENCEGPDGDGIETHGPDCPTRQLNEGADEETILRWEAEDRAEDRRSGAGRATFTFLRGLDDADLGVLAHGTIDEYADERRA